MISANPRLDLLRWEVERTVLKPFRLHGWAAEIVREVDRDDCIEIAAQRGAVATRIAGRGGFSVAVFRPCYLAVVGWGPRWSRRIWNDR